MGPAPLPAGAGQGRADRGHELAVRVGGDQLDAGQAAGGQVPEEPRPPRAVLGGGDLQAQDLPVPVGVDPGGEQRVDAGDPAALADFQHQGVRGQERIGPGVQRPGPERLHLRVQVPGHLADL
jgi:hypothetical protein